MQKRNHKKKVLLLCDDCHCCPEVTVDQDMVEIIDDFGGKVKFTKGQFDLLKEKIREKEL